MDKFCLYCCKKRTDKIYKESYFTWEEILNKFKNPVITSETQEEYFSMSKDEQSDIKDVGGFVPGKLKNGERTSSSIISRNMITLDIDDKCRDEIIDRIIKNAKKLKISYIIHSTHKATSDKPRVRVIIPLSEEVDPFTYEFLARQIASDLVDGKLEIYDATTFQANRMMYYPSISKDAKYLFYASSEGEVNVKKVLTSHPEYTDKAKWPYGKDEKVNLKVTTGKIVRGDSKGGIVGAFCKVFSLEDAIQTFLNDIYTPGTMPGRYSYIPGSVANGLRVYKDTDTAKCEDNTDPANVGTSLNAFDLVRIHKYGTLDKGHENEEITSLPSYKKMCERAKMYKKVREILEEESKEELFNGIKFVDPSNEKDDNSNLNTNWVKRLETVETKNGKSIILQNSENFDLIFENDPALKGLVGMNEMDGFITFKRDPYWKKSGNTWSDTDDSFLVAHFDKVYHLVNRTMMSEALLRYAKRNSFNPVKEFIESTTWDGIPRVETLFIDYNGAQDSEYTRVVTRKFILAAIARIYNPGCKWDYMPILVGDQGCGKSEILFRLAGGRFNEGRWFQDAVPDFRSKSAYEAVDGKRIVEIGELANFNYSDRETIKLFLSKNEDSYRKAYAKNPSVNPRTCVFVGTTNENDFLKDSTGERRFFPIACSSSRIKMSLINDFNDYEVRQVWAEAYEIYKRDKEPLTFFPSSINKAVDEMRKYYSIVDPRESSIEKFLSLELPESYFDLDVRARRVYLAQLQDNAKQGNEIDSFDDMDDELLSGINKIVRDRVCPKEILEELFNVDEGNIKRTDYYDVSRILRKLGWEKELNMSSDRLYGRQFFYKKVQ